MLLPLYGLIFVNMYFFETISCFISYYLIRLPISFLYKLLIKEKQQQQHHYYHHYNSSSSSSSSSSVAAESSSSSTSLSSSLSSSSYTDETDNSESDETIYNNNNNDDTVATAHDVKRRVCERGNTTSVYTGDTENDVGFLNIVGSGNINISSTYIKNRSKEARKNNKWLHSKHKYNTRVSSTDKSNRGCNQYNNNGPVTRSVTAKLKEKEANRRGKTNYIWKIILKEISPYGGVYHIFIIYIYNEEFINVYQNPECLWM